ncbi:MAG: hypothetical protein J7623_22440, partial [Chitinophaga sp.]|uniref:MBG domain-containing protein n=1 Tax=Chitinophaga sp. TaxID=1869181 RepID=UPI001B1746CE
MKLPLRRTLIMLLLLTGLAHYTKAQSLGPGDILFTGFNSYDDNTNGLTQNDKFSFVLLKDCPIGDYITFTDLGWTAANHFQSLSCGAGNGSQTDGVIEWRNTTGSKIRAGQQVVISCKYNPVASLGTISHKTATASDPNVYINIGEAGDQLFAISGAIANISNPTVIAGININRTTWDATLNDCDFTSSQSMQPGTGTFPSIPAVNARYNCLSGTAGTRARLTALINDPSKWNQDNTLSFPVPAGFDLNSPTPCNLTIVNPSTAGVVYVKKNVQGDGSSWTSPLPELRDALAAAADPLNGIKQIWVAAGTYTPSASSDPNASFVMPSNIAIYGGFQGQPFETSIANRNIPANRVVLSGDLGRDDADSVLLNISGINGTNSLHVVTATNVGNDTLDGVIITAGQSSGRGGGLDVNSAFIRIYNTQFSGNSAISGGGAIGINNGSVYVINSTIFGNQSGSAAGIYGTNLANLRLTNVTITGNTLIGSSSTSTAVYINSGSIGGNNCILYGNLPSSIPDYNYGGGAGGFLRYSIVGTSYYSTSVLTPQTIPAVEFVDAAAGNLQLTKNNFAINHGDPQTNVGPLNPQAGSLDLAGKTRINNTVIDLGAYEYQAIAQTITFPIIPPVTYGDADFNPGATTTGDTAIVYSSSDITVADTVAGKIHIKKVGTTTITANAPATNAYLPATAQMQNLTVKPKDLLIKANDVTRAYHTPNSDTSFTITGFVNGEDSTQVITGRLKATFGGDVNSGTGTYQIQPDVSGITAPNYHLNTQAGTLTIVKGSQTITFPPIPAKTYGDAPFTINATSSEGLPIIFNVTSGNATILGNTVTIQGIDSVTITAYQGGDGNVLAATPVSQTFYIAPKTLTVTANAKTKAYKQPNPTLDYTVTGYVYGQNSGAFSGIPDISTTADANSAVGKYLISVTQGGLTATNYNFSFVNDSLTVIPASQTITFDPIANKTYGDAAFTVNATSDANLPVTYSVVSGPATIAGNTVTITGVGNVTIAANQPGNSNYLAATQQTQSFTIDSAILTVTATPKTKVYGQPNPTLDYTITGFVNNEDNSVISGNANINTTADINSNAGKYLINVTRGGLTAANYTFIFVNDSLEVTPATQTITFSPIADKTYGDAPFTLSASSSTGLPVTFAVIRGNATWDGSNVTITGTDSVTIAAYQAGDGNHAATEARQSFNIAKAELSVIAAPDSRFYLQPNPTLRYYISGMVYGEKDYEVTSGIANVSTPADNNSDAGKYVIHVTQGTLVLTSSNYNLKFVDDSLEVMPATQTITFDPIANKTYGDAPFKLNAITNANLPVSFSVLTGPASISGDTVTIFGTGSILLAANADGNHNYSSAGQATQSFTVNKANLTVTANPKTKVYLQPNPTLDYTFTGFVYNEDNNVIHGTADITTTADVNSIVGKYPINVAVGGLTANNYTFSFVNDSLEVTPATQTITFSPIPDKTYGDPSFTLNASSDISLPVTFSVVSGPATVSGNTVTITGTGQVTIAANQAGNGNYAAAQTTQSFNIAKAILTVTANPKTKAYKQPNPTLDYQISGYVYGENSSVVSGIANISTAADVNSPVNKYLITVAQGGLTATNYSFQFVNDSLEVTPATQTITFAPISNKTYGDADFTVNASSDASLPVTYSVVSGPATINGNTVTITGTGNVTIAADQAGNSNYQGATQQTQSFTVNAATLTVTANPKTKVYKQPNPTLDYTITGFVKNENSSIVSGNATITTTADVNSAAGKYLIEVTQGGLSAPNYTFAFVNDSLEVTAAAQTIDFSAISGKTYGDAPFTVNATSDAGLPVTFSIVSGSATVSGNTVTITGSGDVTIAANQAGSNDYSATQTTQTFNIAKAKLTVTAKPKTKVYLQPNPTLDYSITGYVYNENSSVVSGIAAISTTADVNSPGGQYPITVGSGNLTAVNYDFDFVNDYLTVTPAAQTITFTPIAGKTYGDAPFTVSASSSAGLPITYSVVSGPATNADNTIIITGAGTVVIAADQAGNTNYGAATQQTQSFTVAPATLTVRAVDQSKNYKQPNPTLDYQISGFKNGDTKSVVTGIPDISTTADINSPTGTYPINVSLGGLASPNYTFSFQSGTLYVNTAIQTITFDPIPNKTYGDAPFTITATSDAGLPVSFNVLNGQAIVNGNTVTILDAGNVTLTAIQPGDGNYAPANSAYQSFSVAKALLTVKANSKTKAYQQANPTLDYTFAGFVNNDNASAVTGIAQTATTADINSLPGSYPITITQGTLSSSKYNFSFQNNSLTVTAAGQSISFTPIPAKTYGDAAFSLNATSSAGLPVTYSVLSGPATINGNNVTITGAGNVTIAADQAGNGNYQGATRQTQSFTVSPATLTVKADDKQKVTGTANPTFTYTVTGFVNGDNSNVVTGVPTFSTTADNSSVPGTYPITVAAGSLSAPNYQFTTANGTLTVTPTTQTITFPAITGKTYGAAAFTLNATSTSGLPVTYNIVSGPATISGNTVTITGAGNVTIAANQAGNATYLPATQVTQSFTVGKATLTVTAVNASKVYQQPNPAFTYNITGFVNGENNSVVTGTAALSTTATTNSTPGTYPITVAIGSLSATNYQFTLVNGTLTIGQANQTAQTITFPAITGKTYGAAAFTLNATSTSGL